MPPAGPGATIGRWRIVTWSGDPRPCTALGLRRHPSQRAVFACWIGSSKRRRALDADPDHGPLAVAAAGNDRHSVPARSMTLTASKPRRARWKATSAGPQGDLLSRRRQLGELPPRQGRVPPLGRSATRTKASRRALAEHRPLSSLRKAPQAALQHVRPKRASTRSSPTTSPAGNRKTRPALRSRARSNCASTVGWPNRSTPAECR